jgi:aspartyl-tRNA(Asn)/glutamyl-tRNA(Gln) amidotransferase subunit C
MISEEEVARTAYLARVQIDSAQAKRLASELSSILKHFEQVSKVDTKGVEPLVTPTDMPDNMREDKAVVWESAEAAMANAPEASGNLFKVPPVVG